MAEADSDISVSELGVVEGAVVSLMGGGEIASGQLQVLCHGDPEDDDPSNVVFLSLDGWVYPLLPGMPAVAVKPLFYLLPASDGSRYALQLPEDVDEEQATTLEAVFVRYARFVRVSKADGEEAEEEEPAEAETADEGEEKEGDDGSEGAAAAAMSSLKSMSARFGKKAKSARSKGVALLGRMAADVKAEAAARSAASGTDEGEEAATSSEEVAVSVDGEEEGEEEDDSRKKTAKATKIAHGIEKGSVIVAAGLVAGAKMTGKGMKKTSKFLQKRLGKAEKERKVSKQTRRRLRRAKMLTGSAATVSAGVLKGAVAMTACMGAQLAHAGAHTKYGKMLADDRDEVVAAKTVTKSSLVAFSTIMEGLDEAIKLVLDDMTEATVELVEERYGEEAGSAVADGMGTVSNVVALGRSMNRVGVGALAKRTAREAAKVAVTDGAADVPPPDMSTALADAGVATTMMKATMLAGSLKK